MSHPNEESEWESVESHDDWSPLEPEWREAQMKYLLRLCRTLSQQIRRPARVLDLGCGDGSVLCLLARDGHTGAGLDRDPAAIAHSIMTAKRQGVSAEFALHDFTDTVPDHWPQEARGPFDLVLCLGNTWMMLTDPRTAIRAARHIAEHLVCKDTGVFIIDDIPGQHWPLVADGSWVSGLAEDGSSEMQWSERDNVFALRDGERMSRVDASQALDPAPDHLYRLWTQGELELLACCAGFDPTLATRPESNVIVFPVRGIEPAVRTLL